MIINVLNKYLVINHYISYNIKSLLITVELKKTFLVLEDLCKIILSLGGY